jgi:hypothetical protein
MPCQLDNQLPTEIIVTEYYINMKLLLFVIC